nr:putative Peroxidase 48 [Ipomoea batatas]
MDFKRHLFLVFTIVVLIICLKNQNAETNKNHSSSSEFEMLNWSSSDEQSLSASLFSFTGNNVEAPKRSESLRYDYYDETCPQAEHIVQSVVRRLYMTRPRIAPQLLRLVFHDCFVQVGGPFYPLTTGRRDSNEPHLRFTNELPAPTDDLPKILEKFSSKGFKEWEIVSLLGSHSTGVIHCNFFSDRLGRTSEPDPSIDTEFLNLLRSKCNVSEASSALPASGSAPVPSDEQPTIEMDYKGPGNGFGTIYYQSLLQSKGILFSDQQMIAAEETAAWVQAYALDVNLFRLKFCRSMMKLSNLGVLTASKGRVRLNCRKVH